MFLGDSSTISNQIAGTNEIVTIKLSGFGVDLSFETNLSTAIIDDGNVQLISVSKGFLDKAFTIIFRPLKPMSFADMADGMLTIAKDTAAFTLGWLTVDSISSESDVTFKAKEDKKAADAKLAQSQGLVGSSLFGDPNIPTSEKYFGLTGTHIALIALGLGTFFIWTKVPSMKGKRR